MTLRPSPAELRALRLSARLSQTAAALLLGVSRASWARWERPDGRWRMPPGLWIATRAVLETSTTEKEYDR